MTVREELVRSQGRLHEFLLCISASPQDTGDLLQRANLEILRHLQDYDPSRPALPWFLRFAGNVVRSWRRERKSRTVFDSELTELLMEELVSPEVPADPRAESLNVCLDTLPAWQRELLEARHLSETPLSKLAKRLQISSVSLSKTLWKIREALRNCILARERKKVPAEVTPTSESDKFLSGMESLFDGKANAQEFAAFAEKLKSDKTLRRLYIQQACTISLFMRCKRTGKQVRKVRLVPIGIAAACLVAMFSIASFISQSTHKREEKMKAPLVLASALTFAASADTYQFIISGYPVENSKHSAVSAGVGLVSGKSSASSIGTDLEIRSKTQAKSPASSLNSTKYKGTVVVLI